MTDRVRIVAIRTALPESHVVLSGGALHLQDGVSLDQLIQVAAARMYERKGLRASERT